MSQAGEVDRSAQMNLLRQLISDAASETPRTVQEGAEQIGAIRFLQRKLDEMGRKVITGD